MAADLVMLLVVLGIAAVLNFLDASLGMGYGTTLTIILFLLDYNPDQIVLPILISGVIAGLTSSLFHIIFKNMEMKNEKSLRLVNISFEDQESVDLGEEIKISIESKKMSKDSKVVLVFTFCGIIAAIGGAYLSSLLYTNPLSNVIVKIYIGILVLVLGLLMILLKNKTMAFSFKKIIFIGCSAGFNKSISGGGFGPVAITGQMLIGREGRKSIASTALSETIISVAGIVTFLITDLISGGGVIDYSLIPSLTIGACITAPFASFTTTKIDKEKFKTYISLGLIALSAVILFKIFFIDMQW